MFIFMAKISQGRIEYQFGNTIFVLLPILCYHLFGKIFSVDCKLKIRLKAQIRQVKNENSMKDHLDSRE